MFALALLLVAGVTIDLQAGDKGKFRTASYGSSVSEEAAYIALLQREGSAWRVKRLNFDGTLIDGPVVKHATAALALIEGIVIPCSNGQIEVLSSQLDRKWSFHVKSPKNIALACRVNDLATIALLTLNVSEQRKFVEFYKIDFSKKTAQLIKSTEVPSIGGLAAYAKSLWLLTSDQADLIQR